MQVVAPLPKEVVAMVLKPVTLGCASQQPAAEEHSLAILHKLVRVEGLRWRGARAR